MSHPRRDNSGVVMASHLFVQRIDDRIVTVRCLDTALEVIGNKPVGNGPEITECMDMRVDKRFVVLGVRRFGVGVITRSPAAAEQLNRDDFSGGSLRVKKTVAAVVDK